jgi:two-component system, chemotaxis family, protein-glutamate methylesterase/glutaminase
MSTKPLIEAIVIGGSAGALEALSVLLPALPAGCPFAVAVVVHLSPSKPSRLAEVLGVKTVLPVKEVEDKEPVVAGTVYVGPPGYHLLIERGRTFALSADELIHYSRPAIDVLFESAAEAYGDRLAGIVLTGANADGARGLLAVKQRGGLAVVQSPEGAQAPAMPEAAIALARPDLVLPIGQIAGWLANLAGQVEGAPGRTRESR